jgi:hypothetical protein
MAMCASVLCDVLRLTSSSSLPLQLHTQYVNRHPSAIDLLLKLTRTNSRFRRFLDDCYSKTNMDAESFLILPIQRLPRYELLLTVQYPSRAHVHSALLHV